MSEHLEAPRLRHLSYHRNPHTTLDIGCRGLFRAYIVCAFKRKTYFSRSIHQPPRLDLTPRGNRARRTRRNGERVVGGNGTFIETLSGDQEDEEAIRHLLPLYEYRPPLLIAVAPRPPR